MAGNETLIIFFEGGEHIIYDYTITIYARGRERKKADDIVRKRTKHGIPCPFSDYTHCALGRLFLPRRCRLVAVFLIYFIQYKKKGGDNVDFEVSMRNDKDNED